MRLKTRPFPNLETADFIPYYWKPLVWVRWRKYWNNTVQNFIIKGCEGRIGPLGFAISFEYSGVFHNGSHWLILFRYQREIEEMLF